MNKFGFIRVGASVPEIKVTNVIYNVEKIKESMLEAEKNNVEITVFPELSLTGYTCADMFFNSYLIDQALNGLIELKNFSKKVEGVYIIGLPIAYNNNLCNSVAVIEKGNILGIVPKCYISNGNVSIQDEIDDELNIDGVLVPFKTNMLFKKKNYENVSFGVEIGEELNYIYQPANEYTSKGATMIFNLSATPEIIGKREYIEMLIKSQSAKTISAYIYASSGCNESTTDMVYSGMSIICENGKILEKNKILDFNSTLIFNDIDIFRLLNMRYKENGFKWINKKYNYVEFIGIEKDFSLVRKYDECPFVPSDEIECNERCANILNIQAVALAKRLKHTGVKKSVIGISGGLDSTLAFLVTVKAYKILGLDLKDIIGITMPGFGTTNRTYTNACEFVTSYGATLKEISIKDACIQHFKDIEQEESVYDVTYENAQARERTQILMDYANKIGGFVIGTGDLSELALGWCTYNGDHMSMYGVNAGIPKTLVRHLVKYYASTEENENAKKILLDILDTPVSPELLPPSETGEILQQTEKSIGPYILHDFFIYHFLRYGADPLKIFYLAKHTFKDVKEDEIKKWLLVFIKRFFQQQFKRSCSPDGPKVGTISLSPRGDLKMPSDADVQMWISELEKI